MLCFELKNFLKHRTTVWGLLVSMIIIILFPLLMSYRFSQQQQQYANFYHQRYTTLEQKFLSSPQQNHTLERYAQLATAIKQNDWQTLYKDRIQQTTPTNGEYPGVVYENYPIQPETIEATNRYLQQLQEKNLSYGYPMEFMQTPFEQPKTPLEKSIVNSLMGATPITAFSILWSFLDSGGLWIFILMSILLFASIFIENRRGLYNSRRFFLTQPVTIHWILIMRSIIYLVSFIVLIVVLLGGIFLIDGIKNGFGTVDFPIITYLLKNSRTLVTKTSAILSIQPLKNLLPHAFLFFIGLALLWMSVIHFCTSVFSNAITGSITGITFCTLASFFFHPWNPFGYFSFTKILTGWAMVENFRNYWSNPWIIGEIFSLVLLLYSFTYAIEIHNSRR